MHDLSHTGELPQQQSVYPKVDADPDIGPIRYVLLHKALMPESNISLRGALSLKMKYAIRHIAGTPVKWFGLAPYNPVVEVQPLFVSTRRPPRLKREEVASSRAVQSLQGSGVVSDVASDAEQTTIMNARDIVNANVSSDGKSEKSEKSANKETKESKISNTGKIARIDTGQIKAVKK